ncbi:MAG: sodium-translocating pyrophosphatase [Candidatus Micrarchaeota archaeon]|nr:sodium-translocating pyrophosphatase [Candidatus Micrarchaeota archaeon]
MIFGVSEVYFALAVGILAILYSGALVLSIVRAPKGNERMQSIAKAIEEGANAYLMRQYITLLPIVLVLAGAIYYFVNLPTAIAFLAGVLSSSLAGYIGMQTAVRSNVRVAEVAGKGLPGALAMAFRGGAVTGMALVGLGLVGLGALYILFDGALAPLVGYGFGASLISLFARVGGGIYTKAADVGADLVGKVEKGIPEDDPRNPAVIADNVGDNVGDCAGMAADVFESFVVTVIAAMLLGSTAALVTLPLGIAALGVLAGIIGSLFIRLWNSNIMFSFYVCLFITAAMMLVLTLLYTGLNEYFYVTAIGAAVTFLLFLITEYYTGTSFGPVKKLAQASSTGAGTNLITGLAIGMESTLLPALLIVAAMIISFKLAGLYGVALAAAAMLSLSGIVIAVDSFGPITDNAGGIAEMSGLPDKVRKVTDALDAVGNTTKATTKGFAIGGAALGALALFAAFATETQLATVNLLSTPVVVGLFIGALLPFVFSSLLMLAVGRAAFEIVQEVRRQFKEIKGLMEGKAKADYAKCVDISTATALRELALPGVIAVFTPLIVGYLFGAAALAGLLAGAIASGFLMALFMCTAGAAWDNAKKYIEGGNLGGKGSDTHKAAVVGDTVGDPLKDTAGPALNALIKVLNTVSLVFAGAIVAMGLALI